MDPPAQHTEELNVPTTLREVENLVLEMYRPGQPRKIAAIQEALQKLQRSPEGWDLASGLLESPDEKVKFFGALTYMVKLNSDWESLNPSDVSALLGQLINWLIRCLDASIGSLVIRKLCSTLVVYFLRFSSSWSKCVQHLIRSLCAREALPVEATPGDMEIIVLVERLTTDEAMAVLWFSMALAEEIGKTDANHVKHHKFHDRLKMNAVDVVALIASCLAQNFQGDPAPTKLRQEAMKCFQSWVLYSHRAYIDAGITLEPLKTLTKTAIACLVQDDMFEVTAELFSDILANYSKFLNDEDFQQLFALFNSEWSSDRYNRLVAGDYEFDSLQYGQFMIAFGDATVQELARREDVISQRFLTALAGLLVTNGYTVAEDRIFVPALEFWSTFVEVMIDSLYSEEVVVPGSLEAPQDLGDILGIASSQTENNSSAASWFKSARAHVIQAIEHCWRKIKFPPDEIFDNWDSVDRIGFGDARKDVADLLESSYTLAGSSLFSLFARMTLGSLQTGTWLELEASIFCLGALADCIDEDTCNSILTTIFGSGLFDVLADQNNAIPIRTRQTALSFIGQYDNYFERHAEYLPNALNFLFKALKTPGLSTISSRSIQSLCSSCRNALTSEIGAFLQQYGEYISIHVSDSLVKERITGAIAAIIQAVPTEARRKGPLIELLRFVEIDFEKAVGLAARGENEAGEAHGLEALRCMASIAKGFQVPIDIPLDLDGPNPSSTTAQFWINGDGGIVQKHIQNIIERLVTTFPKSGDVVEAACAVLRAGFTEKLPGPFVFASNSVANFLLKADGNSPRVGAIISTACCLISSHITEPSGQIDDALRHLLFWLFSILHNLKEPTNDPEIAQTGIDFVYRLLPTRLNILMEQPTSSLERFFMFTLQALTGRDPLPKSAAADFWSLFVALTNLPASLQASTNGVMEHLGPALAEALVYNISGNAARSELDKLSEPLRKLVARQIQSKSWLEAALSRKDLRDDRINPGERKIFLQKVMTSLSSLRGAKQTNQVVKDFWLACRGSSFAYTS